jgi:hypothetical protein
VRGPRALQRHVPVLIGQPHHDVEAPVTGPYVVVNLSTSYAINQNLEVFGVIENLFDTKYSTFGTLSPTAEVPILEVPGASITRSPEPRRTPRILCRHARQAVIVGPSPALPPARLAGAILNGPPLLRESHSDPGPAAGEVVNAPRRGSM